jgi:hypothetical protein
MRVTIVPDDKTVILDSVALPLTDFPPIDAQVHAVQFFPDTCHAEVEKKIGERGWLDGDVARALIAPFVAAHRAEAERLQAVSDRAAAQRAAAEKEEQDRHALVRAELAAADQNAADQVAAAETIRRQGAASAAVAAAVQAKGNLSATGTQIV